MTGLAVGMTGLDPRVARRAPGLLGVFSAAGVLAAADVHTAVALGRLGGESDEWVLLATALAVRGTRAGSVVLRLATAAGTTGAGEEDGAAGDPDAGAVDTPGVPAAARELPWPEPGEWARRCQASPLVASGTTDGRGRPLRLVDGRLWLARYWQQEEQLVEDLLTAAGQRVRLVDVDRLRSGLARLFPAEPGRPDGPDDQRLAAAVAALWGATVVAGGPGTGKTTTVARLLALLHDQPGPSPRVALAAPTGKAAARLTEAVTQARVRLPPPDQARLPAMTATTLHRLLGRRPGARTRFRHNRDNRLPHDLVVVDETSMVSLTLMARLLEALRPGARLVLLGDPDQLASVEAGAVLGDLVDPERVGPRSRALTAALREVVPQDVPADLPVAADTPGARVRDGVVLLRRVHRFSSGGGIAALAAAVRAGAGEEALRLLEEGAQDLTFAQVADDAPVVGAALARLRAATLATGWRLAEAAAAGAAGAALDALDTHRLLCAHRSGPRGVRRWSEQVARWLAEVSPSRLGATRTDGHFVGQPLLVTANDYDVGLFNGDTGVVVRDVAGTSRAAGGLVAAFRRGNAPFLVALPRLGEVRPLHAMTVHRAQGSQFATVSVLLPPAGSPLGTRETFYTAVTRATEHVLVIGSPAAVIDGVQRRVARATGLRERLT